MTAIGATRSEGVGSDPTRYASSSFLVLLGAAECVPYANILFRNRRR